MTLNEGPDWRPAIISALAALAVYAITLGGTYVYDDLYIVQADERLTNVSLWYQYWTKDYFNGGADNLYRPLVSMTYALQAKLHGTSEQVAWAFHLVNWLLHAGVSALVAELARRMTRSSTIALIAGLLFAVHPIHVEAVANIVGRAELMCALGIISALVLYLRPLTPARAIAIWLCFLLAMLSKEQGILLPLLLLLATPLSPARPRRATLTLVLLLLWTLALYIFFRERILKFWWDRSFLDPVINPILHSRDWDRFLMPFALLGRYIALLVVPLKLNPDYGGRVIGSAVSLADPHLYIGFAATLLAVGGVILAMVKRAAAVVLCIITFGLLFGMVSNFLTIIGVNFGERLMYIPSAFVCILGAMLLARLPQRAMTILVAIIVLLFCVRTITYAWRWNDRLRLYSYSAAQWPESVRLRLLLAEEFAQRGKLDQAETTIAQARQLGPDYYKVWIRSATIALQAGKLDEAMRFAERAHELQPTMGSMDLINEIRRRQRAAATATSPASAPAPTR